MTPRLPLNQAIDRGNKLVHLLNSPNFAHLIKVPNFCVKFPLEDEICDIPGSGSGRLWVASTLAALVSSDLVSDQTASYPN